MTTRHLFISFFLIYGLLIPVFAQEFVTENTSASIAMVGSCIIIALLFWLARVFFINVILAFYVFQSYLLKPFFSIFEQELSVGQLAYLEDYSSYFNPEAAAVVYWSLFSLLLAWLMGLLLLKRPWKGNISFAPKIFTRLDQVILKGGLLPLWFTWGLLFVLQYETVNTGLRGAVTGEGSPLFLWGLVSLYTIEIVFLFTFLKRRHAGLKPARYFLLVPPSISALLGILGGGRSAAFTLVIVCLVYWLWMNINKKWKLKSILKTSSIFLIFVSITIILALFAQVLKPLYASADFIDNEMIKETLNYKSILLIKENLQFGITRLLHRLSILNAQFYILNDWHIHNPWQYYNPVIILMRVINDLVPGTIFPGMLNINQLFYYIYYDQLVHYASETWGIQGTLYLIFGHFLAPIVVFYLAVFTNRLYPSLKSKLIDSPAFAAFFISLLLAIVNNGTFERIIPVDIVRPLVSYVIFVFLYKAFSLFLPTRVHLSKRGIV